MFMHYTGLIYRPPFEAESLLLQVTEGCSHNRCSFCTMYRDIPFAVSPLEEVEADLKEVAPYAKRISRVFLENGDPFALSAERLKAIAELINRYLPEVDTIAMYASVNNIKGKTDAELAELRRYGINELNIGVESGLDAALARMNKGYTAAEAGEELFRLKAAGIDWGANVIFGAAGAGHWEENAEATAALLNKTKPYLIFTGTIHADEGCPLYNDFQSGAFEESTFGEYLDEEERFLSLLDLDPCFFFGRHPSNVVPMQGWLNQDKEKMIEIVRAVRARLEKKLHERPRHGGEGAILNR